MGDMTEPATMVLNSEGLNEAHTIADRACSEGWCGNAYPKPCDAPDCNGLIHASFGDENADGDYWLHTKCDVCGEPE